MKAYYIDLVNDKRKGVRAALFSFLLLLISFIYGFFIKVILSCYQTGLFKSYKSGCRVISVGNITWGGTGKTPLVETVAKFLMQQGKKPAILIRGYGKDEVYMLKDKFKDIPVLAGRDRVKTAKEAKGGYAVDTIILDDGFQHWPLKRDLDIVLIDASSSFGNRRLIPRGSLREPLSSLNRADIFVLTKTDEAIENIESIKEELRKYNPQAPVYEAIYAPNFLRSLTSDEEIDGERSRRIELSAIKNQRIAIISGIARPESFAKTLDSLGAKISLKFFFLDHYQYRKEDLEKIEKQCLEHQIKTVVTTEKDAPKLIGLLKSERLKINLLALGVEFKIVRDEEKFFRCLLGAKFSQSSCSILILSDGKAGHLNQSKALARIIQKRKIGTGLSNNEINTKVAEVKFRNGFCRVLLSLSSIFSNSSCRKCLRCLRFCLKKDSFYELIQAPANVIVSAGSSLSSVNLFLSYRNNARKVILMKPSLLSLNKFDLVIVPEHDRIMLKENVLLTRIAPNLIDQKYLDDQAGILNTRYQIPDTRYQSDALTIGVLIGGDTPKYRISAELMSKVVSQVKEVAENLNCQILVTTSRRTSKIVEKLLKDNLGNFNLCKVLVIANERNIPEAVGGILGLSDIVIVSGESISMVSEAVSAEKYVLVFRAEKKVKTLTKQDRFLEKLEKERILKVIRPDNLFSEIKKIWKEKPKKTKIQDRELIYQALGRVI